METLPKQTSLFGEEELTSSRGDFHASPFQWQESEKARRMRDTSGRRCLESFGRLSRPGSWAKTFSALLIGMEGWYSSRCRLTWRLKGTKYNRMFFQLVPSTLPIEGIGSGLLPTITTQEIEHPTMKLTDTGRRIANNGSSHSLNLADTARMLPRGLMPTPQAMESPSKTEKMMELKEKGLPLMSRSMGDNSRQFNLKDWMMYYDLLPTPRACESIERRNMKTIVDKVENGGDVTLTTLAKYKGGIMLPTPRANESTESVETINNRREKTGSGMMNLTAIARLLPTPATRDYKGARTEESLEESGRNHTNSLPDSFAQLGTTSQLNPRFVAEMMGFPPNWLELPFLNTETNQ